MFVNLLKPEFDELIAAKDWVALKEILNELPAVDVAELLEDLDPEVAVVIFRLLKKAKAADVFSNLSSGKGVELLEIFSRQQLSDVMNNLEPDEQVALMEELPGHLTKRVLSSMEEENQKQVRKLLGYPEESVGRLMTTNFVRVKSEWTIEKSLEHLREYGRKAETLNVIYVVDENEKLIDDLRLNQLILSDPYSGISDIMDHSFEALSVFDDQEEAVRMLSKYDRVALPVVDSDGILVGIVTVDDVIDVAEEETTEDMHLMAGMNALDDSYSQTSIFNMVKKRIGWLVILFMGQMLTVTAMANYEDALAAAAILSFFIPMIISSGGNSGSQAATLIIRAVSTDDIKMSEWKKVLFRESVSGLLLGSLIGAMGSVVIANWMYLRGEPFTAELILQALTVGSSLVGVVLFGNLSGSMLPFIMAKLGFDPAVTSAPFVATLVDVTGIIIYFSIASLLLSGIVIN
ncbi:MAG TPA: magnesium transporter [Balneolaceae bacterium]|nr:magnesium transporter [Balneolaceae bacterium]